MPFIIKKETTNAWVQEPYEVTRVYTEWQQLAYRFPDRTTAENALCAMEVIEEVES